VSTIIAFLALSRAKQFLLCCKSVNGANAYANAWRSLKFVEKRVNFEYGPHDDSEIVILFQIVTPSTIRVVYTKPIIV